MKELFELVASITLDGVEVVNKALTGIDKNAFKVAKSLRRTGAEAAKVGGELSKYLTLPIVALGATITKFGGDFDKAMTNSLAIMGDLSDGMKKDMSDAARQVSTITKYSATEAAKAYYYLASAGLDAAKSIKALPLVAKFAQAGNFDLALATDLLTDAQSALGMASKDTQEYMQNQARVSDVLVKANVLANASVQQFSEALTNRAGAALRILGKDIEEGVAVLAAYADQGTKGAEAGTQLSIVMRDLQKTAINNKEIFARYKVSVYDSNGEMRNMADILADLEKALAGTSDEQKKTILSTMDFQEKSVASLLTLIGTSDKIREYEKNLRLAGGTTESVSNKQIKNFNDQMILLKNKLVDVGLTLWQSFSTVLTEKLVPALDLAVKQLKRMADWYGSLPKVVKEMTFYFTGLVAVLGPTILLYGKMLILFGKLIPLTKKLSEQFGKMGMAGQMGVALTAALLLNDAINTVIQAWSDAIDKQSEYSKTNRANTERDIKYLEQIADAYDNLKGAMDLEEAAKNSADATEYSINQAKVNTYKMQIALKDLKEEYSGGNKTLLGMVDTYDKVISRLNTYKKSLDAIPKETTTEITKEITNNGNGLSDNAEEDKSLERRRQYLEDLSNRRYELEKKYTDLVDEQTLNRTQLLEKERDEALRIANETGADKANIEQYYNTEINRIKEQENFEQFKKQAKLDDEYRDRRIEYERKVAEYRKNIFQQTWDFIVDGVNKLGSVFSMFTQNRLDEINNEYQAEREAIENSTLGKKEKARQLEELDKEQAEKERALKKKQAAQNKAFSIFNIIIDTAMGIAKIWAQSGVNFIQAGIMSGVLGTISAANIAAVASQPIPMADGGIIKSKKGGVLVNAAEAGQDEMFIPMKTGVKLLADALLNSISNSIKLPSTSFAQGNSTNQAWLRPLNVYVGTWLGDESGIKKLAREITNIQVIESQRVGAIA